MVVTHSQLHPTCTHIDSASLLKLQGLMKLTSVPAVTVVCVCASRWRPRCWQNPDRVSGLIHSSSTSLTWGGHSHKRLVQTASSPLSILHSYADPAWSMSRCFLATRDPCTPAAFEADVYLFILSAQNLITAGGSLATSKSLTGPQGTLLFPTNKHLCSVVGYQPLRSRAVLAVRPQAGTARQEDVSCVTSLLPVGVCTAGCSWPSMCSYPRRWAALVHRPCISVSATQ